MKPLRFQTACGYCGWIIAPCSRSGKHHWSDLKLSERPASLSIMETQLKAIRTSQSIIVLRGSREALNWCPIMPRNASLSDRKREIFPSFPCAAGQSVDTSAGGCDMQSRGANYETIPSTSIREAGASRHHLPPIKALHVTPNCTSY